MNMIEYDKPFRQMDNGLVKTEFVYENRIPQSVEIESTENQNVKRNEGVLNRESSRTQLTDDENKNLDNIVEASPNLQNSSEESIIIEEQNIIPESQQYLEQNNKEIEKETETNEMVNNDYPIGENKVENESKENTVNLNNIESNSIVVMETESNLTESKLLSSNVRNEVIEDDKVDENTHKIPHENVLEETLNSDSKAEEINPELNEVTDISDNNLDLSDRKETTQIDDENIQQVKEENMELNSEMIEPKENLCDETVSINGSVTSSISVKTEKLNKDIKENDDHIIQNNSENTMETEKNMLKEEEILISDNQIVESSDMVDSQDTEPQISDNIHEVAIPDPKLTEDNNNFDEKIESPENLNGCKVDEQKEKTQDNENFTLHENPNDNITTKEGYNKEDDRNNSSDTILLQNQTISEDLKQNEDSILNNKSEKSSPNHSFLEISEHSDISVKDLLVSDKISETNEVLYETTIHQELHDNLNEDISITAQKTLEPEYNELVEDRSISSSNIVRSIIEEIVDSVITIKYHEIVSSSIKIVDDIIEHIITNALLFCPDEGNDSELKNDHSKVFDEKKNDEKNEIEENKEKLDSNIREEILLNDNENKQCESKIKENLYDEISTENIENASEYGLSSKTDSVHDAKVEGKRMSINERPKGKERKLSITSKKPISVSERQSVPRKESVKAKIDLSKHPIKTADTQPPIKKELKEFNKRMSLDSGKKDKKTLFIRKTSDISFDKRNKKLPNEGVKTESPVRVYEKSEVLSEENKIHEDTDTNIEVNPENFENEVKFETFNNESSTDFIINSENKENVNITNADEKNLEIIENDTKMTNKEENNEVESTVEDIIHEKKDSSIVLKSPKSEKTESEKVTEKQNLIEQQKVNNQNFDKILLNIKRRLSLNQLSSSQEVISSKTRSSSVINKPRNFRRYSTLNELSLERKVSVSESLELPKKIEKNQNKIDRESKTDLEDTHKIRKEKKIESKNMNTFDEEKQNEENELKSQYNNKIPTSDNDQNSESDIMDQVLENNIISCEVVKEVENPYELGEEPKEPKQNETKSQSSYDHTLTIEVKDETSEIHDNPGELPTEKGTPWIIDNWDCNPEEKIGDNENETVDQENIKSDLNEKSAEIKSKPSKTENMKSELRKKFQISNYNATPVEKYLVKPSLQEKPETIKKEKFLERKQENKSKEKPQENKLANVNNKNNKSSEKLKESKQPTIHRKKLQELTLDNSGKKRKTDETENTLKNSNEFELRRIKSNIETLRIEIKKHKPEPRNHVPFVFNDLQPYGDTNMCENFKNQKPMSATAALSRMTAIDLCEPWESYEMDKLYLPPLQITSANIRSKSQMSTSRSFRRGKSANDAKLSQRSEILKNSASKERCKSSVPKNKKLENSERRPKLSSRRIDDDYRKTKIDLCRLSLEKYDSVNSARGRSNIRKALFAYLQNSPGSRRALYEMIHKLDKEKSK